MQSFRLIRRLLDAEAKFLDFTRSQATQSEMLDGNGDDDGVGVGGETESEHGTYGHQIKAQLQRPIWPWIEWPGSGLKSVDCR